MVGGVITCDKSEDSEVYYFTIHCVYENDKHYSKGEVLEILLNMVDYAIKHNEEYVDWID